MNKLYKVLTIFLMLIFILSINVSAIIESDGHVLGNVYYRFTSSNVTKVDYSNTEYDITMEVFGDFEDGSKVKFYVEVSSGLWNGKFKATNPKDEISGEYKCIVNEPSIDYGKYNQYGFDEDLVRKLKKLVKELNQQSFEVVLDTRKLVYQTFTSMNNYKTVLKLTDL